MTDPLAALEPFVNALRLSDDGSVSVAGRPFRLAEANRLPTGLARWAADLTACVYVHAYSRPFSPDRSEAAPASGDLSDLIQSANGTPHRIETGWTIAEARPDGTVIATRYAGKRRLLPGQFVLAGGATAVTKGAQITAHLPGGSRTLQPGFFYCFSQGLRNYSDLSPLVRVYWNLRLDGVKELVHTVTGSLNRYGIPFDFKVATNPADYDRSDNAVLYLADEAFPVAMLALGPHLPSLEACLAPDVPLFTKKLAPGMGVAEDPGQGESFGMSRSKLVAAALLRARRGEAFDYPNFRDRFAEIAAGARLRLEALWLQAGSDDRYRLSPLRPVPGAATDA